MKAWKTLAVLGAAVFIAAALPALPAHAAETLAAQDNVGDRDNFGFGRGTGPPPCAFFDNQEPSDDDGFDIEVYQEEAVSWTHDFSPVTNATRVQLFVWEIFSDDPTVATISLDGKVLPLIKATGDVAPCDGYPEGGIKHYVQIRGAAAAAAAADGHVNVTFKENGDDIAFDRAILKVYTA
jgi:hypothetical protein